MYLDTSAACRITSLSVTSATIWDMAIEPIPDLLAELRAGRYPYDFIEEITGGGESDLGRKVRYVLRKVLATDAPGEAFTRVLVFSLQRTLLEMAQQEESRGFNSPTAADVALKRIMELTSERRLEFAAVPDALYRP